MELVLAIPAFVKVGICFAAMLILYRCTVPFGWAILCSTALLALMTGKGLHGASYLARSFLLPSNLLMLAVILLLTFFSDALSRTGRMEKTVNAFRLLFKNQRVLLAGLPALIGLLPMPGGALFSAPFIASVDTDGDISAEKKAAINYWFRHIWEFWWPLYPGVILALQYTHLPLALFFLIQVPFTAASILGGYLFLLRPLSADKREGSDSGRFRDAIRTLWPVAILVMVSVAASALLPSAGISKSHSNLLGMLGGLIVALALIFRNNGALVSTSRRFLSTYSNWMLMLAVASALLFSAVLQMPLDTAGATLVSLMRDEFIRMGIPILLIIAVIPFISGMATGITVGFVGAGFPIVFALVGSHPPLNVLLAATAFAYVSGYIGEMLSPMHICYIMSTEYFKARLFGTFRYLLGPAAVVAVAMLLASGAYYLLPAPGR